MAYQQDPYGKPMYPPPGQPATGQPIMAGQPQFYDPYGQQQYPPQQHVQFTSHTQMDPSMRVVGQTSPIKCKCPNCQVDAETKVKCSCGSKLWVCCLVCTLPLLIGCPPCCCLPFLIPSWYEYTHYCQACGQTIGGSRTGTMNNF